MGFFDFFGSAHVKEKNGEITISGLDTEKFLSDIDAIWRNKRVPQNMFKNIRKYNIMFDSFFATDVFYQLDQIHAYKKRKSNRFRIEQAKKQLLSETWMKSTVEDHPDILDFTQLGRLKFKLLPTQMETLQTYNKKVPKMLLKGFLLGTPPGSGKTLMSIALSITLHSDVAIFVVPKATVTTVWDDGIIEQFGHTVRIWSSVRNEPLTEDYDYYIFHYEALEKAILLAKMLVGKRKRPFIAIDESHNLNEITSNRTLRLIELSKILNCQHTVFATGTPVKALGIEMVPLLRTIDRFFTPSVELRFMKIYGATAKRANDILRNRLGLISHKILEADYMKIAPPIELERPVKIPDPSKFLIENIKTEMRAFMIQRYEYYRKNMKFYEQIYKEGLSIYEKTLKTRADVDEFKKYKEYVSIIIERYDPLEHGEISKFVKEVETRKILPCLQQPFKNKFKDCLSIIKYAKLRVLGESLAIVGRRRAECAVEIARYGRLEEIVINADKKTIIFSSFIPALVEANAYFEKLGFKTLQVHGDFTKNLTNIVNQFKQDQEMNPLFGTLQSLAASQTLTVANTVVFLDAPFREYIRNQAYHRVFRIGQDAQTYTILCLLDTKEPNISDRSADILKWSQTQCEDIFGSATREEVVGIVKQLKLNPPATGSEQVLNMVQKVFTGKS